MTKSSQDEGSNADRHKSWTKGIRHEAPLFITREKEK